MPPDPGALFLTQEGEEISTHRLSHLVRDYVAERDARVCLAAARATGGDTGT